MHPVNDKITLLVSFLYQMEKPFDSAELRPQRQSLITESARALRECLAREAWHEYLPGERELSLHFQISRPTLRAALDQIEREGLIERHKRCRTRILKAGTKSEPANHRCRIAAISPRPLLSMPPSAVVIVDELRAGLARAGYALEIFVNPACFTRRPERALHQLTSQVKAAAWITFGSREDTQRWFHARNLPCLVAGSCAPGIPLPSIDIDYRAACRHAGGLLKRKGHDRVLLCLPESSTGGEAASEAGFREGYKGDVAGSLSILKHNGTPEHLRSLLDRHLSARKPPVGIVVARAIHALTVLTYFLERGIRPGCDLSLISRDDEPFLDHVCPRITRYSVDPSTFQRKLVQAALRLVENRSALPRPVRLIPTYLPGETA
ncbi:MAG: substrate-binding domain-containing protein [Verrucomicrobiae bacterium]|nr:substrate-binding domain-containing protein [Verrucomicrobiae bacterium]